MYKLAPTKSSLLARVVAAETRRLVIEIESLHRSRLTFPSLLPCETRISQDTKRIAYSTSMVPNHTEELPL